MVLLKLIIRMDDNYDKTSLSCSGCGARAPNLISRESGMASQKKWCLDCGPKES